MKTPEPILVAHLFPDVLASLLELLSGLSAEDWKKPTSCSQWSVKDVAAHLLWVDASNLSRKRDDYSFVGQPIAGWDQLVALINELNNTWVKATRGLSPRVLCDLLKLIGGHACDYFSSLDPFALGEPVNWAGPQPAPVWLDLAREHTERWHHQQQIRDAVDKPGLKEPKFFAPVLDAFARALPHTYKDTDAPDGVIVALTIAGDSGGRWLLKRENGAWQLYVDDTHRADAEAIIDQDIAWRLFSRGISRDQALAVSTITGDLGLASKAFEMVSVIA
jgi:uncharacterized protein (TIGR03083 family)